MLTDAQQALAHDLSLRTVEDRSFYAMYHACLELLERLDLQPRTQAGSIALFGKEVVMERGLIEEDYHRMLSKYQAKRQEADYEKVFLDDREDAEKFLADAEDFISRIKAVIDGLEG